jgi:hypothetical protein
MLWAHPPSVREHKHLNDRQGHVMKIVLKKGISIPMGHNGNTLFIPEGTVGERDGINVFCFSLGAFAVVAQHTLSLVEYEEYTEEPHSPVSKDLSPVKEKLVNECLTEICMAVNALEQKSSTLRNTIDFGISGTKGCRGVPLPRQSIQYTKEVIGYILEQLDESAKYMESVEYKHRLV